MRVSLCAAAGLYLMYLATGTLGSKIIFNTPGGNINPLISESLSMRCSLNDSEVKAVVGRRDVTDTSDNVPYLTSLVVTRAGQDVASISQFSPARAYVDQGNLHVVGDVSGNPGERGFLELTWDAPSVDQVGEYKCEVHAFTDTGHIVVFSKNLTLDISTPSLDDLVKYVQQIEQNLMNQVGSNDNTACCTNFSAQVDRVDQLEGNLAAAEQRIADLELQMTGLEQTNANLSTQVLEMDALNMKVDELQAKNQNLSAEVLLLMSEFLALQLGSKAGLDAVIADVAKLQHVEDGSLMVGSSSNWPMGSGGRYTSVDKTHTFNAPYDTAPTVLLSLTHLDYTLKDAAQTSGEYTVRLVSVTETDFTVRFEFNSQDFDKFSSMIVNWVSLPN